MIIPKIIHIIRVKLVLKKEFTTELLFNNSNILITKKDIKDEAIKTFTKTFKTEKSNE